MAMGIDHEAQQHHDFVLFSLFVYLATGTPSSSTACVHIGGALKFDLQSIIRERDESRKINRNFMIQYEVLHFSFSLCNMASWFLDNRNFGVPCQWSTGI
jgi:hypothetical protein